MVLLSNIIFKKKKKVQNVAGREERCCFKRPLHTIFMHDVAWSPTELLLIELYAKSNGCECIVAHGLILSIPLVTL